MASYRRYGNANPFNKKSYYKDGPDTKSKCHSGDRVPYPPFPTTLREVLLSLIGEQVAITVPYGVVDGTLIAVRRDYILLVEPTGNQVLIRIDKIELVSEL
ncbi:hypothetical protein CIL03_07955 [Virgibacillus indicus]|uniref:DUF2642 domain-containing protein n=1 Tax=Virgibacillus indicus TaxID=2024554 RepID=A0A265NCE2_9BACI|nr:DUF2642 domain-containing protein [Virgibacillus indicus]OZU88946.1 hypothetical protein CIL03_07955 [Virgibacillus indicus]